jgi:hypothetical protein
MRMGRIWLNSVSSPMWERRTAEFSLNTRHLLLYISTIKDRNNRVIKMTI